MGLRISPMAADRMPKAVPTPVRIILSPPSAIPSKPIDLPSTTKASPPAMTAAATFRAVTIISRFCLIHALTLTTAAVIRSARSPSVGASAAPMLNAAIFRTFQSRSIWSVKTSAALASLPPIVRPSARALA